MNTKIIKFDLNKNLYDNLIAKQGDTKSRFLLFNLLDGSIPFSLENRSVRVYAIKPDGTEIFNDLIITDAAKGYCILELTTQMLAVAGTVKLELMVIEDEKKLTSNIFYMDVKKSINSEKAVVSTNEFGALLTALQDVDNWNKEFTEKSGKLEELYTPRLNALGEQLDTKAKKEDVKNVQQQVNNLVLGAVGDGNNPEVVQARGNNTTLDARITSFENKTIQNTSNLFDYETCISDKYIDRNNGNLATSSLSGCCASHWIQVTPSESYFISHLRAYAFYDSSKSYLSGGGRVSSVVSGQILVAPENACYLRITSHIDYLESMYINEGSDDKGYVYPKVINDKIMIDYYKKENVNKLISSLDSEIILTGSNIFDYDNCEYGKFVNRENGTITDATSDGYYVSDWIMVKENTSYFISHLRSYAIYNKNKEYIAGGGRVSTPSEKQTITTPQNAYYLRITSHVDYLNIMYINEGSNDKGYSIPRAINDKLMKRYFTKDEVVSIVETYLTEGFNEKVINCLGDSITYGYNGAKDGDGVVGERVDKPYPTILSEILNCTVNNYGQNGSTIGGDGATTDEYGLLGYKPMNIRYKEMGKADYNIIWGGTNDCYASGRLPLGTINDTTNLTFYGSLKILIEGLIRKYPTSKICFLTPLQRTTTSANSYEKKLIDYVNAIIEVCEMYGIPYLDLYRKSGCYPLIAEFKNANLPDGLHPNQSYYYIIAYKIAQFIKSL